jgi:hypothetical protein
MSKGFPTAKGHFKIQCPVEKESYTRALILQIQSGGNKYGDIELTYEDTIELRDFLNKAIETFESPINIKGKN